MKILHPLPPGDDTSYILLSQYFYPEEGATSELLSGLLFKLKVSKINFLVLAGQPSYYRVFKVPRVIRKEGVLIYRLPSTRLNKNTRVGRILNTISFAVSAFIALSFMKPNKKILSVTNPPLLLWICRIARLLYGFQYILILHDVYPEIAEELGILSSKGMIAKLWTQLNQWSYKGAENIVVLGRDMKNEILQSLGHQRNKEQVVIIPNWADEDIRPLSRKDHPLLMQLGIEERFVIQYSGNIGLFHEIETIVKTARGLLFQGFTFFFIGEGKQRHIVELTKYEMDRKDNKLIVWLPFQPRHKLPITLTACDIGLVTLREGLEGLAVPSKLYGILAAGKPVVAIVPDGSEVAMVVQEEECGWVVTPGDSNALMQVLVECRKNPDILKKMGHNAYNAFRKSYTLSKIRRQWESLLVPSS